MAELKAGDPAPDVKLPLSGGGAFDLAQQRGRATVLYFYPKDDTTGCTAEAIGFSQAKADFAAAGADVVGVSPDTVAKHDKFAAKYELTIPLGADPEKQVIEAYGLWVEKSLYGRKYMGVDRSTFLIDGAGVIRRVWRKVKVPGHVAEVLAAARELAG
jgi:thioredoxin-dependent peroxiredoxin